MTKKWDDEERAYMAGKRTALLGVIRQAFRELDEHEADRGDKRIAALISELDSAKAALHTLYEDLGWEITWPAELHLGDIIEKHVAQEVRDALEDA